MQEAWSATYLAHYTNLFGSLSHQAGDSRSLWLMRLHDAPLIPPQSHDLYNKDFDMRKLERQCHMLPDLLNSCPDIASKVTRVHTPANMLAAAPLASSMLVR